MTPNGIRNNMGGQLKYATCKTNIFATTDYCDGLLAGVKAEYDAQCLTNARNDDENSPDYEKCLDGPTYVRALSLEYQRYYVMNKQIVDVTVIIQIHVINILENY